METESTHIYNHTLHDALPICHVERQRLPVTRRSVRENKFRLRVDELADEPRRADPVDLRSRPRQPSLAGKLFRVQALDRKSTRLNSSHSSNSYAVYFLKI